MAYIFDTSKGETPEVVAQRRKLSDALAARIFGRTPQNIGEGLSALGQAWIAGTMRDEADATQKAGQAAGNDAFNRAFGGSLQAGGAPNAGVSPMGALPSMENRVYSENEFNPIDAQVATQDELADGVPAPKQYASLIGKAAVDNDLPPELLAAQIKQESGFNPMAVSHVGAAGISQFMPGTAKEMGVSDPFNPQQAIPAGARYLRQNIDRFGGSVPLGLAAYNAGPGRVQQSGGDISRLPTETQNYVQNITGAAPDAGAIPAGARPTQAVSSQSSGPGLNELIQLSTNPWLSEGHRAVVNTMLQQKLKEQQQASDPLRQLQIKKAEADLQYGKNPESVREYEYAKAQGFKGSFQDWIATKRAGAGEYGLQGIPVVGPNGEPALAQLGKSGNAALSKFPEGYTVSKKPIEIDGGTETILLDPITRQRIGSIPKDLSGKKSAEAFGKGRGEARLTLPQAKTAVDSAFRAIDGLRSHPGIDIGTGLSSVLDPRSWIPGQSGYDFSALNEQAQGKAFMTAREALKGAGQVTDFEGQKGEQAIANLKTAQSKEQYLRALDELERMLKASYSDLQKKAGVVPNATGAQPQQGMGNTTSGGVKWSVE